MTARNDVQRLMARLAARGGTWKEGLREQIVAAGADAIEPLLGLLAPGPLDDLEDPEGARLQVVAAFDRSPVDPFLLVELAGAIERLGGALDAPRQERLEKSWELRRKIGDPGSEETDTRNPYQGLKWRHGCKPGACDEGADPLR